MRILFDVPFRSGYADDGKIRYSPISAPASRGGLAIGGADASKSDYEYFGASVDGLGAGRLNTKAEDAALVADLRAGALATNRRNLVAKYKHRLVRKEENQGRVGQQRAAFTFIEVGGDLDTVRLVTRAGNQAKEYRCKIKVGLASEKELLFQLEVREDAPDSRSLGTLMFDGNKADHNALLERAELGHRTLEGMIGRGKDVRRWSIALSP